MNKPEIRAKYRTLRAMTASDGLDIKILDNVFSIVAQYSQTTIGMYYPVIGEPQILKALFNVYGQICLPRIDHNSHSMYFLSSKSPDLCSYGQFSSNKYGILEPVGVPEDATVPNILIIPGAAFCAMSGHRVGMGGGYYDRYIGQHKAEIQIKIGICYNIQILSSPQDLKIFDAFDQPVEILVTESLCKYMNHNIGNKCKNQNIK